MNPERNKMRYLNSKLEAARFRKGKKLAALRSKSAAKYHLQTAITPFAILTYFYQGASAISI